MKRLVLITGRPGIGKTSVLHRATNELQKRGYIVGGMISREVCEGGIRVGFEITDIASGQMGWLAHTKQRAGPKIGKYRVNLTDLNVVGVGAILDALRDMDIIIIDEIGPMELASSAFRDAVLQALESNKPMLGTIHFGLKNPFVKELKNRGDAEVFQVTHDNREGLHSLIVDKVIQSL